MKINDIFRKLHKNFILEAVKMNTEVNLLKSEFDAIIKHKRIIRKVINDYNFKGRYFKVEFLPAILAMALEEGDKKNEDSSILNAICYNCDIKHF